MKVLSDWRGRRARGEEATRPNGRIEAAAEAIATAASEGVSECDGSEKGILDSLALDERQLAGSRS